MQKKVEEEIFVLESPKVENLATERSKVVKPRYHLQIGNSKTRLEINKSEDHQKKLREDNKHAAKQLLDRLETQKECYYRLLDSY